MDKSIEQLGQDLAWAKYAERTQKGYIGTATHLGSRFGRPVAELTREEIRTYVEEIQSRGKSASWVVTQLAPLSFLYRKTLGQPEKVSFLSYPKRYRPLPTVLSLEEVGALIGAVRHPLYQAIVMVLYGAGLRISEALSLEVTDIDGARGVIRVRHGKGNKAREAKLSSTLYTWLRRYWSQQRPAAPYLFASRRTVRPPVEATVRAALAHAAKKARIKKRVTPHVLRRKVFRAKMLYELQKALAQGAFKRWADFEDPPGFDRLMQKSCRLPWNVYAKPTFPRAQHVVQYLGRYTHRVGLANSRLLAVSPSSVTFRTKGGASLTLAPVELLRRFVQHVLPVGFHKIRHIGLPISPRLRQLAHLALKTTPTILTKMTWRERLAKLGRNVDLCPQCGAPLICSPLPEPRAREPPILKAAA